MQNDEIETDVLKKLENIERKIERIEEDIGIIKTNSILMKDHIKFIENLYQTMRHPLNKILSYFS